MRLVIFTADADLEFTPWWPIALGAPGLTAVLVVRRRLPNDPRSVVRRLRRNVRTHGWIFIPYRILVALRAAISHLLAGRRATPRPTPPLPIETIEAPDVHADVVIAQVAAWRPDLGLSLGAPILKPQAFRLPPLGTLNIHLGRVPQFRGAPPGFWELWHGARDIGATVHWMDEGLDTGPVVDFSAAPIFPDDTVASVEARAAELGRELLASVLARLAREALPGVPQSAATRAHARANRFPTLTQRFVLWTRLTRRRLRLRWASPAYSAKLCAAAAWLAVLAPVRDLVRRVRGGHPVRVFAFHRVTELCRDGMTVRPETFARQIDYVRRHHDVVDLEHALDLLADPVPLRRPVAVITFDDGYRSVYDSARPVLEAAGVRPTCFVCTDLVGTDARLGHDTDNPVVPHLGLMNWDDLTILREQGWGIGGHTATHPRLASLTGEDLDREVRAPIGVLRRRLGIERPAMAYPFGGPADITDEGTAAARAAGYAALFSDHGGENFPGRASFALRRIDIGGERQPLFWKVAARGLDFARWRVRLTRGREQT